MEEKAHLLRVIQRYFDTRNLIFDTHDIAKMANLPLEVTDQMIRELIEERYLIVDYTANNYRGLIVTEHHGLEFYHYDPITERGQALLDEFLQKSV